MEAWGEISYGTPEADEKFRQRMLKGPKSVQDIDVEARLRIIHGIIARNGSLDLPINVAKKKKLHLRLVSES